MQRDRDEGVRATQDISARANGECREGRRERPAVAVFERMDQRAQRTVVTAGTPRAGKGRRLGLTPRTQAAVRIED
jgi:hypothetical protein